MSCEAGKKMKVFVPTMACMHCVARIEEALKKVKKLEFNVCLEDKSVTFNTDDEKLIEKGIKAIEKGGYKVPDDVSVTGFDCSENDRQFGNYTSVKQNFREIGHLAIKTLLSEVRPKSSEIIYSSVKAGADSGKL